MDGKAKRLRDEIMNNEGYGAIHTNEIMITGNLKILKEAANSDGFHTFDELYEFRKLYNAGLFNMMVGDAGYAVHKSRFHSDGEPCFGGGWFIVVAYLPTGQISNHYEEKDWDLFQCEERIRADEWDGHTPQDVVDRMTRWLKNDY